MHAGSSPAGRAAPGTPFPPPVYASRASGVAPCWSRRITGLLAQGYLSPLLPVWSLQVGETRESPGFLCTFQLVWPLPVGDKGALYYAV